MRLIRILQSSLRTLSRHRARTGFMMLGTFVGVVALSVVLAIGQGTRSQVLRRFDRMLSGSTMFVRAGGGRVRAGAHAAPTSTLTLADIQAIDSAFEPVLLADPMQQAGEREVTFEGRTSRIRIEGHAETAEIVWNRPASRGAYFTAREVGNAARVALVGEVVVRDLFQGRDPVGKQIRIGAVPFHVTGVLAPMGIDPHGQDKDNEIVIPITTMLRRVRNVDYLMGAKLLFADGVEPEAMTADIRDLLRRRHGLVPGQEDDFHLFTPVQIRQMIRSANRVFTLFLPLVAGLSILIGGLVVGNLMLAAVQERRSEIGLRKAIGARPSDIRLQFLTESAMVTGLGGLIALGAGWMGLKLLAHLAGTPAGMPWTAVGIGMGCAIGTGLLAGVIPARRAAQLDPVQTLR